MLRRFVGHAALLLASACSHSRDHKVWLELPSGAKYREAQLTSSWFGNTPMIGPIGGPTHGYDLAIELWPEGPTLPLQGAIGKDELASDPVYRQLRKKELALKAEPDGHALVWSIDDGDTWHALWLDGPLPFECGHRTVTPGSVATTRDAALEILTARSSHPPRRFEPARGVLSHDSVEEEGALAYALAHPEDAALAAAAAAVLGTHAEAGRLREKWATSDRAPAAASSAAPPVPTTIALAAPRTDPLPSKLTPLEALEWVGFPPKADAASCASWKQIEARVSAEGQAVVIPPKPEPAPKHDPFSPVTQLFMAAQQQMASFVSRFPFGGAALFSEEAGAIVASYRSEAAGCGHVGEPDMACRARLREAKERLWWEAMERSRRRSSTSVAELHESTRQHLERAAQAAITEPWSRAQMDQAGWTMVAMVAAASKGVCCPPERGPVFSEPLR